MRRAWWRIGAVCWAAGGCLDVEAQISVAYDPELPQRLVAKDPARDAEWAAACDREPSERLGLPAALQREPSPRSVPRQLAVDLTKAVKGLPRPFAKLFRKHVCAVVLMHGAPMSGTLMPLAGDRSHSVILLNVDNLSLPPNEWLSFKESSAFEPAPERFIRGKMAHPDENVRSVLLEFLLVHELSHVVDQAFPEDPLIQEFKRVSWPRRDALVISPFIHYPQRVNAQPLPDAQLEPYYDLIAQGAFASPATVANAKEDFADSVATFLHTVLRRRPWQLEVLRNGKVVRKLQTCWAEPRCADKRRIVEALLRRWESE